MIARGLGHAALAWLQQGYRNNWQRYLAALGDDGARDQWDVCVLTASNARQAEAYQAQLAARGEAGLLPARTRFVVLADPGGRRIGSGGATLRALAHLARDAGGVESLVDRRVLMLHSGGDSRRLPHCSALGKLFCRVPHQWPDGRPSSLFDEFLVSLSGLPGQVPPGVLVASGDVLLLYDHLQLELQRPGVTGVAAAALAETANHHGVYVAAPGSRRVRAYLHKPDLDEMRARGALLEDGQAPLDTGLVWLDAEAARRLLDLAARLDGVLEDGGAPINLYGDLLAPLAEEADRAAYLADASDGEPTAALRRARELIWSGLRGLPFGVERLDPALFVHFGTTREYLDVLRAGADLLAECGWRRQAASWLAVGGEGDGPKAPIAANALLRDGQARDGVLLDACIEGTLHLEGEALLAHVLTDRPYLALRPGVALHQLPLRDDEGWVTRLYGLDDDPKRTVAEGGTFLNQPWREWLDAAGVEPRDLWGEGCELGGCSLWEARLYPRCPDRDESLEAVLWLQAPHEAGPEVRERWRAAGRLSLAESYGRADVGRIVAEQVEVEAWVRAARFLAGLTRERPAAELAPLLGRDDGTVRRVADALESTIDPWLPIRGYRALAVATGDERWDARAFSALARLVRAHTPAVSAVARRPAAALPERVVARAAARLDLGGGWTDTPPYSLERGGLVLNAAVSLRGELPIVCEAERLAEPALVIAAGDIEISLRPRSAGEVLNYANPADPLALHKAALVARGFIPSDADPRAEVSDLLRPWGCGLRLTTATFIPRGSGLGTSSILAGAILRALAELDGQTLEGPDLFDQVLCLEQMITTGGGWQDQIGGLVGGIKRIRTAPGLPQVAEIAPAPLSPETRRAFDARLVLIYTGQRRLAKNLLRAVMGRYMARDPEMVAMLAEIARLAEAMYRALGEADLDTLGELVAAHWEINKRMDPACTNPLIDELLASCAPYIVGAKLAGAGGGGFALIIARDEAAARELSQMVGRRYAEVGAAVWPASVADPALVVAPA